jgi:uncharacterized HAD superfamily protein
MKIGIDFDDVTVDFFNSLLKWHNKKYNRKDKREDFKEFAWWPIWNISREEAVKRVDEFHETHKVQDIQPMKESIPSLNKLSKDNELIVITGRPSRFKSRVQEWLLHHFKKNLEIIHAGEFHKGQGGTKAEICKELNIPILLEDAPETALDCANQGIKVILFDKPWNQKVKHKGIIRVSGWEEAMKKINDFSNKINS